MAGDTSIICQPAIRVKNSSSVTITGELYELNNINMDEKRINPPPNEIIRQGKSPEPSSSGPQVSRTDLSNLIRQNIPTCNRDHQMIISSFSEKAYKNGYKCSLCRETYRPIDTKVRWFCNLCNPRYDEVDENGQPYKPKDVCFGCIPVSNENYESCDWATYFLNIMEEKDVESWSKSRVLVLSGTDLSDTFNQDGAKILQSATKI